VVAELSQQTSQLGYSSFPEVMKARVSSSLKALKDIEHESNEKLRAACPLDLTFNLEIVTAAVKDRSAHLIHALSFWTTALASMCSI